MKFKILYVEDEISTAKAVEDAVAENNEERRTSRPVSVKSIRSPDQVYETLDDGYDLVLADVYFPTDKGKRVDRLNDIIDAVERWSNDRNLIRPLPIIAYTSRGKPALESCLKRRHRLYDIWDKFSASAPYVAWRFNQLALEFTRSRPDALLQRKILSMSAGASWHDCVKDMATRYNAGWTERDQVERCGVSIQNIAHRLKTFDVCDKCWRVMLDWEALGRAVSRRTRGHARHVINVFWLGYYLLHHPCLQDRFSAFWSALVKNRSDMAGVADEDPLEALSTVWFYAALFHDIGGCVEKHQDVFSSSNRLLTIFGDLVSTANCKISIKDSLEDRADALFHALGDPLKQLLFPSWTASLKSRRPDHGVVAAVHIVNELKDNAEQLPYAREAARAMIIHNLIGGLTAKSTTVFGWETEPIGSLLVLCDQIQTWDRSRDDRTLQDRDEPERAELSSLRVEQTCSNAVVKMGVDYIAPRHLDHAPEQFAAVKDALDYILKDKPNRALARIAQPWPFCLFIECWLNGQPLNTMEF